MPSRTSTASRRVVHSDLARPAAPSSPSRILRCHGQDPAPAVESLLRLDLQRHLPHCRRTNPRYHALLSRFKALTGCPVIVNTSFNVRGEPIVGSPEDAFRCFMGTEIETLAVGNCFL